MDGGEWWAKVHGAAKSQTWLSDMCVCVCVCVCVYVKELAHITEGPARMKFIGQAGNLGKSYY